ncbi:Uncharacterised protein [Mycobacteroides abscessus subsp. abscessus]|nr:Uncharacterised protein [Mycobacteroides abscessus subsp. abscessus]
MLLLSVLKKLWLYVLLVSCLMHLKVKAQRLKNVMTCIVWLKPTKHSLTTASKRLKQALIRRVMNRLSLNCHQIALSC